MLNSEFTESTEDTEKPESFPLLLPASLLPCLLSRRLLPPPLNHLSCLLWIAQIS
jgi:hypothetical protein